MARYEHDVYIRSSGLDIFTHAMIVSAYERTSQRSTFTERFSTNKATTLITTNKYCTKTGRANKSATSGLSSAGLGNVEAPFFNYIHI